MLLTAHMCSIIFITATIATFSYEHFSLNCTKIQKTTKMEMLVFNYRQLNYPKPHVSHDAI